ncbi:MAG: peptide chain release factor N(5)-glutamine methyltransferase, partial [Candidatus Moranbacteria bacterium]|nr:peptide chain release factor N(5)-glutamine methyltransferase [Candidatus Moranbacteria bacterium]
MFVYQSLCFYFSKLFTFSYLCAMQKSIEYISNSLQSQFSVNELKIVTQILISEITGFNPTQIIVNKNTLFSDEQVKLLHTFVEKLKKNEPLQYVTGKTEFFGLKIKIKPGVLIPRPETEELVEWITQSLNKSGSYRLLDVGTGSGCIALALKSVFVDSDVTALDISAQALQIATDNALALGLEICFMHGDALQMSGNELCWDLIVSNPPYIPFSEKANMDAAVFDYEPHEALFVPDNDPLIFYRRIAEYAFFALKENGFLFFEI